MLTRMNHLIMYPCALGMWSMWVNSMHWMHWVHRRVHWMSNLSHLTPRSRVGKRNVRVGRPASLVRCEPLSVLGHWAPPVWALGFPVLTLLSVFWHSCMLQFGIAMGHADVVTRHHNRLHRVFVLLRRGADVCSVPAEPLDADAPIRPL